MINTIDMTTMLPRTVEAADLQGRELSQSQHAAEQTAVQFKKETEQAKNPRHRSTTWMIRRVGAVTKKDS